MAAVAKVATSKPRERDEWEIRQDVQTLMDAEKIKMDKPRYQQALKMAGKMKKAMSAAFPETDKGKAGDKDNC